MERTYNTIDNLNISSKKKEFMRIVMKHVIKVENLHSVYLFGSCARGTARGNSDIDLCLVLNKEMDKNTWVDIYSYVEESAQEEWRSLGNKIIDIDLYIVSLNDWLTTKKGEYSLIPDIQKKGVLLYESGL